MNLERFGYTGAISPVNPRRETVFGRTCYKSIGEVPGPVDPAIVRLGADPVVGALEECAARV